MRQRLRNSELEDVFEGEAVRLVENDGLAAAEKLGILTYFHDDKEEEELSKVKRWTITLELLLGKGSLIEANSTLCQVRDEAIGRSL